MSTGRRILAVALLLTLTLGVCVGYEEADRWTSPTQEELNAGLDRYDGQEVVLFVTVAGVDQEAERVTDEELSFAVDTAGADNEVTDRIASGSEIQVHGTVDADDRTVTAERVVIDYEGTGDWLYLASTSLLGVVLALWYLGQYWRLDVRTRSLEPRGDDGG